MAEKIDFRAVADQFGTRSHERAMREDPVLWAQDRLGDHLWSKQREVMYSLRDNKRTLVASCHASGKGAPPEAEILTGRGWVTYGEIERGDQVYTPEGKLTQVVAVMRWHDRPHYKVEFSDGVVEQFDAAHEWNTIHLSHRPRKVSDWREQWGSTRRFETQEIADTLRSTTGQLNHRVPTCRPLSGSGKAPEVDGYLFGYWLGNGTRGAGALTFHANDSEHLSREAQRAEHELLPIRETSENGRMSTPAGLQVALRQVGVLDEKYIPEVVLHAPVEYRLAVVQGLLDADGHATRNGSVSLDLCDENLALGAQELIRGLGTIVNIHPHDAKLYGRVTSTRYRMNFTPIGWEPFRLQRKREAFHNNRGASQASRNTVRTIKRVEPAGTSTTICIEVADPSHMYLTGRALIPTHNSHTASRAIGWWLDVHPHDPTETRVITTAPSWNQVKNVMWAYVEDLQSKANMPGRITGKAEWTFPGFKTATAFGRKPADYDESTFQGFHSTYVLAVVDEAGGVAENIFTSVETITTNKHARILAIANPDDPNSYMAKIWRDESKLPPSERKWNLITISAFDTPNFTGEAVPEKAQDNLLQKEWVEDAERRWGKDDPRYVSKVLARFPDIGDDGLFNLGRVLQSMNEWGDYEWNKTAPIHIGVDVGLSTTGDFSVISTCQDGHVEVVERVKGYDGNRLSRLIGQHAKRLRAGGLDVDIRIDAVGVGRGVQAVIDNHVPEEIPVYWIVGNAASPDNLKWYNFRAAMYDSVAQAINIGALSVPPDEAAGEKTEGLFDEFRSILYEYRGTKLLIRGKDELKRKGEPSPDVLDSICYAAMPSELLTDGTDSLIEADTLMESTDSEYSPIDEWGNEEWTFAPA